MKITYESKYAEHIGSAVAAILFTHVLATCKEIGDPHIDSLDIQFDLGFSDVEFYSALKTLRENEYLTTKNRPGGGRRYIPNEFFFDGDEK